MHLTEQTPIIDENSEAVKAPLKLKINQLSGASSEKIHEDGPKDNEKSNAMEDEENKANKPNIDSRT